MAIKIQGDTVIYDDKVFKLGTGTTAERPATPAVAMMWFNTDLGAFEGYDGTDWSQVGGVTGDVQLFTTDPGAGWIDLDGSVTLKTTYPALYDKVGSIPNVFTWQSTSLSLSSISVNGNTVPANYQYLNNLFILSGGAGYLVTSTDAVTFSSTPSKTSVGISSLAYGNSTYVYVGDSGAVGTSTDGVTWNNIAGLDGTSQIIRDVEYFNGIFAAVGSKNRYGNPTSTPLVATSTDAITWTARSASVVSSSHTSISSIAYGADGTGTGKYIYAVPGNISVGNGTVATSTDAITWTAVAANRDINRVSVAANTLLYGTATVPSGSNGGFIFTSADGTTWTGRTSGFNSNVSISAFAYGNGRHVVSDSTVGGIRTSTDGITWNASKYATTSATATMIYGGGQYLMSKGSGELSTSTDGVTWTFRTSVGANIQSLSYANGYYIYNASNSSVYSSDGVTWTAMSGSNTNTSTMRFAYGNGFYIGVSGATNNNTIIRNTVIGSGWTSSTDGVNGKNDIIFANGLFVHVGVGGAIGTTTNGASWAARSSGTTTTLNSITYGNSIYLYGGLGGVLGTSTDGITWTPRTSGTTSAITSVAFNSSNNTFAYFVNVSASEMRASTSTDGITWSAPSLVDSTNFGNASLLPTAAGGTKYVAGGSTGRIYTSTDAITWEKTTHPINNLIYANGQFVYIGDYGQIGTSTDGITWTARTSGTTTNASSIAYHAAEGKYVVSFIGSTSGVKTSTDAITWTSVSLSNPAGFNSQGVNTLAYGSGKLVGSFYNSDISVSTDIINWSADQTGDISSIVFNNGIFTCVGDQGIIRTSTDGVSWTSRTSNTIFNINTVDYLGGKYVYGGNNVIGTSTDAITWVATSDAYGINSIIYDGSKYVYGGTSGRLASSTDAITWTTISTALSPSSTILDLLYEPTTPQYLALSSSPNFVGTSTDGVTWTARTTNTTSSFSTGSLLYNSGLYYYASARYDSFMGGSTYYRVAYTPLFTYNVSTEFKLPDAGISGEGLYRTYVKI